MHRSNLLTDFRQVTCERLASCVLALQAFSERPGLAVRARKAAVRPMDGAPSTTGPNEAKHNREQRGRQLGTGAFQARDLLRER